jgi:hypothetical protein
MPVYEVVKDERKEERGVPCLTLLIDGRPTLIWCPKCETPGLGEDYFVRRKIARLKAGRADALASGAAPRTAGLPGKKRTARVFQSDAAPGLITTGSGKQREAPRRWRYELGGEPSEGDYATEAQAREACACAAYLTRGKLGRLAEMEAAFEGQHGKACEARVCPERHKVVLSDEGGTEYVAGVQPDGTFRFKAIGG